MNQRILATLWVAASLVVGCQSNKLGGCPGGTCDASCQIGEPTDAIGANANYLPNAGRGGPLAALHGRHHRGPQSHTGPQPGPAMGPPSPTYGYPYYTTRGPRDFLNPDPPSIGP